MEELKLSGMGRGYNGKCKVTVKGIGRKLNKNWGGWCVWCHTLALKIASKRWPAIREIQ